MTNLIISIICVAFVLVIWWQLVMARIEWVYRISIIAVDSYYEYTRRNGSISWSATSNIFAPYDSIYKIKPFPKYRDAFLREEDYKNALPYMEDIYNEHVSNRKFVRNLVLDILLPRIKPLINK